jgi:hypothetical protein
MCEMHVFFYLVREVPGRGARVAFATLAAANNKQVRALHVFFDVVIADRLEKGLIPLNRVITM